MRAEVLFAVSHLGYWCVAAALAALVMACVFHWKDENSQEMMLCKQTHSQQVCEHELNQ